MVKIKLKIIKNIISKLSLGIKNKLNPSSQYLQFNISDSKININITSKDYYLHSESPIEIDEELSGTILGEKFVDIISKLESEDIDLDINNNALTITTISNKYTFPLVKDESNISPFINFVDDEYSEIINNVIPGEEIATIAESNVKGFIDAIFSKAIQQFIYVDNLGALTFTDNIYVNNFKHPGDNEFKILLNVSQSNLLKIFDNIDKVNIKVFIPDDNSNIGVNFYTNDNTISLSLLTQCMDLVNTFPAEKIRNLSIDDKNRIIINKNKLNKALSRLMVFDKKFDSSILDYSKIVFGDNSAKLISVKNHNYEIIDYDKSYIKDNQYECIIRFGDLVNQLKAVCSDTIDISYGNGKAIIINSNIKQIIPEIKGVNK